VAERRAILRRALVVAALALATLALLTRLESTLGLYDARADTNAEMSYLGRLYGDKEVVVGRDVVEDARALMPEEASFAVLVGPRLRAQGLYTQLMIKPYLRYLLVPRRLVDPEEADWVFCIGCDRSELPRGFEPLSADEVGVVFGRVRQ
jgi:hypothetical protein